MKCNYCEEILNKNYSFCPKCSKKIEKSKWTSSFIIKSLFTNYILLLKKYFITIKLLITHPESVIDQYINRKASINPHYFLFVSAGIAVFISQIYLFFNEDPEYLFFGIKSFKGINIFALPLSIAISIKLFFLKDKIKAIPYHIYSFILYLFSLVILEMVVFSVINDILKNQINLYYGFWNPTGTAVITGMSIPMIIYFFYAICRWIKMSTIKIIKFILFTILTSYLLFNILMSLNLALRFYLIKDTSLYYEDYQCWVNLIFETCFSKDDWSLTLKLFNYELLFSI
tara:strand:- start:3292 stop:4149 length:858 start_codon:yes stop_codon:yes gene_type:complete